MLMAALRFMWPCCIYYSVCVKFHFSRMTINSGVKSVDIFPLREFVQRVQSSKKTSEDDTTFQSLPLSERLKMQISNCH